MQVSYHACIGYFELASEGGLIMLRCHWPFDLSEDAWIDIKNRYYVADYSRAILDAVNNGKGKAWGIAGGFLKVTSSGDEFAIDFSRPESGWFASSLQLPVRQSVDNLLLHALPFRLVHDAVRV